MIAIFDCVICGEPSTRERRGGTPPKYCTSCKRKGAIINGQRWAEANRERCQQAKTRWRLNNPEAMRAARIAWQKAHPETVRAYRRRAKKKNPEANRTYVRRRKAIKKQLASVPFTAEQLRQRLAYYGNRCWMCRGSSDCIDHVKPLAKGGGHILCNLRPACTACNTKKGVQWPLSQSWSRGEVAALIENGHGSSSGRGTPSTILAGALS